MWSHFTQINSLLKENQNVYNCNLLQEIKLAKSNDFTTFMILMNFFHIFSMLSSSTSLTLEINIWVSIILHAACLKYQYRKNERKSNVQSAIKSAKSTKKISHWINKVQQHKNHCLILWKCPWLLCNCKKFHLMQNF